MKKRLGKIIGRGDGGYELLVVDFPAFEVLEERGWQGSGHSWGAIAKALLEMRGNADTRGAIRFDCEGDTFVAVSASEAHLVGLSELLGEAAEDRRLLEQAIAKAEADGSME